ncbi:MAG: insulinase family protein [Bacteroides sp.]|nr:insulinase family protein [Bacteroides sp.]
MNLTEGARLKGFTVNRIREEKELNGALVEMTHDKTGAELCWLNNGEVNKTFSVAFKTLPEDSTGVFHILEHSVLCGSDKYPVKEPFVDLLKSSMNTFLNAMTFPDKTMYPVASRNDRDFLNLTSVYLDAVFAPALKTNPSVFHQEGIHTEFDENGKPLYKGVVFNEMKGAMSDLDERIEYGIEDLLFPDNCYRFNSGGDPEVIPNLTYEKYKAVYNSFYHPSNSRFYLDGSVPLEETLDMISSYLERYEKSEVKHEINMQKPVPREGRDFYEIAEGEDNGKKAVLVLGKIIADWSESEKILAASVLSDLLADTNESPLKRAVLSSGLAEDFSMQVLDGIAQPYVIITARNIKDEDSGRIRKIINGTVKKLVSEGIDKRSLTASINRTAYNMKQLPEPQGVYRAILSLNGWLYGGDPLTYLVYDKTFESLRKTAEGDGFERLLDEMLGEDGGLSALHLLPSCTLGSELREREEKRLQAETSALTEEQRKKLTEDNERLVKWQTEPDSAEAKSKLPSLPLSEVSELPELTKTHVKEENGASVLYHPVSTNGIVYLQMYFPLTNLNMDELTRISVLPYLYGELPTKSYGVLELQQRIKTYIGKLDFRLTAFGRTDDKEECTPCLAVSAGMLRENLSEGKKLLEEIILNTELDHKDRIKEIVTQTDEAKRQSAMGSGHTLGAVVAAAQFTAVDAATEAMRSYSAISYMHKFSKSFDDMIDEFLALAHRVQKEAVIRNGLTVSVTAAEEADVSDLISAMPEGRRLPERAAYKTSLPPKMGIKVPSQVAYAVRGHHLSAMGEKLTGELKVLETILSYNYLWNMIRVQGGAYGAGMRAMKLTGRLFCYSYRDPSPARSLDIYNTLSDYVREFCGSDEDLDKLIIAEIGSTEPLRTPEEQGIAADDNYFSGISDEEQIRIRKEMLSADKSKLLKQCSVLDKLASGGAVCVVGHEGALKECEGLEVFEL